MQQDYSAACKVKPYRRISRAEIRAGEKKKRGDCSPLPFSLERQQLPCVPPFYRDKLTTTGLGPVRGLRGVAPSVA
jgi:hypothetical protein